MQHVSASSNLATYITLNHPSAQLMRISLTPGPNSGNGRQSSAGSPLCTLRSSWPASFRAVSGNSRKSSSDDPRQSIGLSIYAYSVSNFIQYGKRCASRVEGGRPGAGFLQRTIESLLYIEFAAESLPGVVGDVDETERVNRRERRHNSNSVTAEQSWGS